MASHMSTDAPSKTSATGFTGFNLPHELEPMGTWAYVGLTILYCVPVIGWIFLIVFSVSGKNFNRRNFSRSILFFYLVGIVAYIICAILGIAQPPAELISAIQSTPLMQALPF